MVLILDLLHIDSVIFSVCPDESDIEHPVRVVDLHYQPIVVSLDIKHHTTAFDDACAPILLRHLSSACPNLPFPLRDTTRATALRLAGLAPRRRATCFSRLFSWVKTRCSQEISK